MKIPPARADAFSKAPDPALRAILFYGPDGGLVRERAKQALLALAEDPNDPFSVASLAAGELAEDGARLNDEAAAISFTGARRVLRVSDAADSLAGVFGDFLEGAPGDAVVLIEAGDLPARAKLRKLFEGAGNAAAVACYRDEGRDLAGTIRSHISQAGLRISDDALALLTGQLGGDRMLTRRELEKLVLYKGAEQSEIGLEDVRACIGDSAALSTSDLALAVADGDLRQVERTLGRCLQEGVNPVGVLRAVANHFQRLHLVVASGNPDLAIKALRPPVFWKLAERFKAQARNWSRPALAEALSVLLETEAACKQTGAPAATLCDRALLRIAVRAGRRAGNRRTA
ncbi:MAG: DNA polymerase III subunit delta [Rhodovibrionaceae bacterium]